MALAVIDGPILQRASTIITQSVSGEASLNIAMAPLLPPSYNALVQSAGDVGALSPSIITPNFAQVLSDYQKNTAITSGITECNANCSGVVQAVRYSESQIVLSSTISQARTRESCLRSKIFQAK